MPSARSDRRSCAATSDPCRFFAGPFAVAREQTETDDQQSTQDDRSRAVSRPSVLLARGPVAPDSACGTRKNGLPQARRRLGARNVTQQPIGLAEVFVQAPRLGIAKQQARELGALRGRKFAVQVGLDQVLERLVVAGHKAPCEDSWSFRSCRAVYRRDLTVLASMPRISPMSS